MTFNWWPNEPTVFTPNFSNCGTKKLGKILGKSQKSHSQNVTLYICLSGFKGLYFLDDSHCPTRDIGFMAVIADIYSGSFYGCTNSISKIAVSHTISSGNRSGQF